MKKTLTVTQAAAILGVTVRTMQRWEQKGRLIPIGRTKTNRRVYSLEQLRAWQGLPQDYDDLAARERGEIVC